MSWHRVQAYTEYSIHWVQHRPNTAYTKYSMPNIVCHPFIRMITSWPLNVASAFSVPPYTIDWQQPARHRCSKVKSPCHVPMFVSQLTDEWSLNARRAIHRPAPGTRPISLDHSLRSVSPNSHDYVLQVRTIMTSKCISILARSQSLSASLSSLDHGLQVYHQIRSISSCKCISKLARLQTPSSHDHGPQVHLQTRSITASMCISKYPRLPPARASPNSLCHGLGVYLQIRWITAS